MLKNGHEYKKGIIKNLNIPPQSNSLFSIIKAPMHVKSEWILLTQLIVDQNESLFEAGHEIAFEQFLLNPIPPEVNSYQNDGAITITKEGDFYIIENDNSRLEIDDNGEIHNWSYDGNLITSRTPDDLPAFMRAIIHALK